jgi:hypothetical protein
MLKQTKKVYLRHFNFRSPKKNLLGFGELLSAFKNTEPSWF